MENEELKPCPFCGGKANIEGGKSPYWVYWIKCYECRVETEAYDFEEDAIAVWNRRVNENK